jgi:hypothetical protein
MSELQASGLLKDDASDTEDQQDHGAPPAEAHVSDVSAAASTVSVEEKLDEAQEESASEAAEQRVLGDLEGCPGWSEVRWCKF